LVVVRRVEAGLEKEELAEGSKVTGAEVEELNGGASATSASKRRTGESMEGVFSEARERSGVSDLTIVEKREKIVKLSGLDYQPIKGAQRYIEFREIIPAKKCS
jgi:hypothetical protein